MDSKAPVSSLCLFKETRADLEPVCVGSLIQIQVPSTSTFSVRARQQRRICKTTSTYEDEESFCRSLASSGSLFSGKARRHPRSFLWRVLQEGKVLELRSLDLSKSNKETREASLTIHLCFPTNIKTGGVALADAEDQDALSAFVLTKGNELYTFTLRKECFCRTAASEEDIGRWCKVSKPATFSISTPHCLIAGSSLQLIVSLSDGRLLQLSRNQGEDGSRWYETTYGDGQWASSLRGLVRWQGSNTIKYDGITLEQGTPIAMALSPDKKHVFAVCLNHTLRVWNPQKATSVFSRDLLCQHREPHEVPKMMLDPGHSNVLQLFQANGEIEGDLYYALTFSPHDVGQFKFWGVRDPDHGERGVRDLFPEYSLKPPDPDPSPESKAIWKVADFKVKSSRQGQELELWILMRSNRNHKLYNIKFEIQDVANVWQDQWSIVASEAQYDHPLPQISDLEPEDATDKWLDFILCPGRFPQTVLETALNMYCSERSVNLAKPKASLKERMCSAITRQVEPGSVGNDLAKYRGTIDQEWTVLWHDIQDLDKARWEVLSLAYDDSTEMPFIAFADGSSAIRTCDRIEIITHNSPQVLGASVGMLEAPSIEVDPGSEPKLPDELATIIIAAAAFRQSFSYGLRQLFSSVLAEELWLDPSYSIPLRIQAFYDRCNFGDEIGSASFDDLTNALERLGGFNGLETNIILTILDDFFHNLPLEQPEYLYTSNGLKVVVNGAREMIALREKLLSDLLALVVFIDMEIDREEMPMVNFDAPQIYVALLDLLRQYQIMKWLAKNTRAERDHSSVAPASIDSLDSDPNNDHAKVSSILENLFALDVPAQTLGMQYQSEALTQGIKDLLKWTMGGEDTTITMDQIPVYVQTNLLANNNLDLASDFLQYQPSTAWSTYIKGRLHIVKGETTEAAIYFQKAGFTLSRPTDFDYCAASNDLLTPLDALSFGNGLPTYYTHILNLFDATSHPTQMSHFAHLALQLSPTPSDQTTTILTSLFQASLQTTDFSTAYSALTRHPAPKTLLPSFISALLSTPNALPQLLSLPFPPDLHADIDALLASHKKDPKILAAWRLHDHNFRGAAAALLPPLQATQSNRKRNADSVEDSYLAVINLLACAGKENDWVLSEGDGGGLKMGAHAVKEKRKVVTIHDVRRDYQSELDRRSIIESGRFGFVGGGEEMDML